MIHADTDLLVQLPLRLLSRVLRTIDLTDMDGLILTNKWFNTILPRTYTVYPYIIGWFSPVLHGAHPDFSDIEEFAMVTEPEAGCEYFLNKHKGFVDILDNNDINAAQHLIAIKALNPSEDINALDKMYHIQTPEMLKTVWPTKRNFTEFHPIPTYAQYDSMVCKGDSSDILSRLLDNEMNAWGITPVDFYKETVDLMIKTDFRDGEFPSPAVAIFNLGTRAMHDCPLWSYVFRKESLYEIRDVQEMMMRIVTGQPFPVHDLVSNIEPKNIDRIIQVFNNVLAKIPLTVLNAVNKSGYSIMQILLQQLPLSQSIIEKLDEIVNKNGDSDIEDDY
jgi:hypothetical protein